MRNKSNTGVLILAAIVLLLQIACNKTPVVRQLPVASGCDTCNSTLKPIDKEIIINLTPMNWKDQGNGQFTCDLGHIMVGKGVKIDSIRVLSMYAGIGRDAIKLDSDRPSDYNGGSLIWYGFYYLTLSLPIGNSVPEFLAIKLELEWI